MTAARAAKVSVEGHLFEKAGRGFEPKRASIDACTAKLWPELFSAWIRMPLAG